MKTIWIVGRVIPETEWKWALQGAFLSEQEARDACRDESYFIGEMPFGVSLPHDPEPFPGSYYPKASV